MGDCCEKGYCPTPIVHEPDFDTFSPLLGPDGEPLRLKYPRRTIGFDLTPRNRETQHDRG